MTILLKLPSNQQTRNAGNYVVSGSALHFLIHKAFKTILVFFSALALQFLRANNIAHMDLKPQNLLLSARENPVLKLAGMNLNTDQPFSIKA